MADTSTTAVQYLIVGGGIAGVTCAEHLSVLCPEHKIVVVAATDVIKSAYNLRQFGHTLEEFDVQEEPLACLSHKSPNITVIKGTVKAFNPKERFVITETEEKLHYRKLCICSGGRPKVLSESNPHIIGIRDTESAMDLQRRLSQAKRVIIVGNGGIALELVYEVRDCEVVWVIKDDAIGSTFFDKGAAMFLLPDLECDDFKWAQDCDQPVVKRMKYAAVRDIPDLTSEASAQLCGGAVGPDWKTRLELRGSLEESSRHVRVEYECEVKRVLSADTDHRVLASLDTRDSQTDWPVYLQLTNDRVYGCDFVISATGVTPNTEPFISCADLELAADGGIKVDSSMRTNLPGVYAAGDACSASWEPSPHWFQMRLWSQARQMGAFAAKCMAQGELPLDFCFELFSHVTRFFGHKVVLLGKFNAQGLGSDYELLLRCTKGNEYVKVVLHEGKMCGAVLIGETDLEETFENLILNQIDLSMFRDSLLDPRVDIEDFFD